jgi:GntR family transcriptional regulator
MKLLEQTTHTANESEQERLQLTSSDLVLRTRRIHYDDDRPLMYEEATLAIGRFPGLELTRSENYRITNLARRYGVRMGQASERASVTGAPPEVARLLIVEPGTPILNLDRVVRSANGQPLEWRIGFVWSQEIAGFERLESPQG